MSEQMPRQRRKRRETLTDKMVAALPRRERALHALSPPRAARDVRARHARSGPQRLRRRRARSRTASTRSWATIGSCRRA